MKDLLKDINRLRKERKAVILAHTYQPAEIQELADYVGDSYGLSVKASQLEDADVIVFCGVSFMAETAAILNPNKTVLMPEPSAGCPMADTITAEQLRAFKAKHPGAPVVCYVNSTAEVKAESDICCTSSNALKVVKSLGDVPEILFVPDQYLGHFVEQQLGRKLVCWNGGCSFSNDSVWRRTWRRGDCTVVHVLCFEPSRYLPWCNACIRGFGTGDMEHGSRSVGGGYQRPNSQDWKETEGHCASSIVWYAVPDRAHHGDS